MQHVAPNDVAICRVDMLRSFGRGFILQLEWLSSLVIFYNYNFSSFNLNSVSPRSLHILVLIINYSCGKCVKLLIRVMC